MEKNAKEVEIKKKTNEINRFRPVEAHQTDIHRIRVR